MNATKERRVELVITKNGWCWTLHEPDRAPVSFEMRMETPSCARGTQKGDVFDTFPEGLDECIDASDEMGIATWLSETDSASI